MPPDPLRKNELFPEEEEEGRTDISFSSLPDGKSASRNYAQQLVIVSVKFDPGTQRSKHGGKQY